MNNKRVEQLRQAMEARQLEALFITNGVNRQYVSGFTGSSGYVVITMDKAYLLTDFRYMTQAAQQAPDFEVIEHRPQVMETVRDLLAAVGVKRTGFEQDYVAFSTYKTYEAQAGTIRLVPVSGLVEELRMVKDERELALIQEAADLADATFSHILTMLKPGITEKEIALEMEFFMRRKGATSTSFETIVASGERSALPHGVASDRVLRKDEFVKFDFGAYMNSYVSDLTRTVVLGKPTDKHREIYDIVLEAQLHALANIRPGMTGSEADALARDMIERHGYGDSFGHSTGHGIGMEIHEAPRLSKLSDTILKPGMVVTVEPGIYIPGFGGVRIEDDIVITQDGIKILTHSTKEFITIDA